MVRRFVYRSLFFLLCVLSFSYLQSQVTDSLRKALRNTRTPVGRINTLVVIAGSCDVYDSAVSYINQCIWYCDENKNAFGKAYAFNSMGRIAANFSNFKEGLKWSNLAIDASIKIPNDTLTSKGYLTRGYMYFSMADYLNAGSDYHEALKYAEKAGNKKLIGGAYNVLGLTFGNKKPPDSEKALGYYFKAEKIDREIKSMRDLGFVLLRIGWIYLNNEEYDKAKRYLDESLGIGDSLKIVEVQKWSLEAYASMYNKQKKYDKALEVFLKSLKLSVENRDMTGIVNSSSYISSIYNKKGDYKKAMLYSDSAVIICERHKIYSALHHAYKGKSSVYESMGDDKSALKFYKKAIKLKDSLFKAENRDNLNELEKKYETEKKEKELSEKNGELMVQKAENEKQQTQRNFFIAGSGLLLLFLIFGFVGYRQKQKDNKLIANQKAETEKQKQVIEEKQREVMDSINYAKRIQGAHLPSDTYINRKMKELNKK